VVNNFFAIFFQIIFSFSQWHILSWVLQLKIVIYIIYIITISSFVNSITNILFVEGGGGLPGGFRGGGGGG